MKKLFLVFSAVLVVSMAAKAQTSKTAQTATFVTINDTLRYFSNKQLYILPTNSVHPSLKLTAAVVTNTQITHVGSIFKNTCSVTVKGLEARVQRTPLTFSQFGVATRLYLCNVSGGVPVFPPIDSVNVNTLSNNQAQFGQLVRGTFTANRVVTGDFAVLVRNVSGQDGDTIKIFRTAGYTSSATNAPAPANKFGEGLGVIRFNGVFNSTTNYNHPAFGQGTDYEFCVAPIVQFDMEASQIESQTQAGACCWEVFTNTNTSVCGVQSHQFNFNEFYRKWRPLNSGSFPGPFTTDSTFTWNLGDGGSPKYYSAVGSNTVHLSFVFKCNQQYTGSMVAKYRCMATTSLSASYSTALTFTSYAVYCGGDTDGTGIREMGWLNAVKIYPNPTADKTIISGLKGKSSILVYDLMGQLVSTQITDKETYVVDLLKQPRGTYILRISDTANHARMIKIMRE